MRQIVRRTTASFPRAFGLVVLTGALFFPPRVEAIVGVQPFQIAGLSGVTKVVATQTFTAVLKGNGTVWKLGDFNCNLTQIAGLDNIVDISAGAKHVVALRQVQGYPVSTSTVWAFGDNTFGQLGNCTNINSPSAAVEVLSSCSSMPPPPLMGATSVAAGGNHSLALVPSPGQASGSVFSWGYNGYGQLGDNSTADKNYAVPVWNVVDATQIAAGGLHSLALRSNSQVIGWGRGGDGQLGNGCVFINPLAVNMMVVSNGSLVNFDGAAAITAGNWFSAMTQAAKGAVWTTGNNGRGELGIGTTSSTCWPVQIPGFKSVALAAAGPESEYALALQSGVLKAWGRNDMDQCGNGSNSDALSPISVGVPGGTMFQQGRGSLAAGGLHSLALGVDGSVWGWGNNAYCALGN